MEDTGKGQRINNKGKLDSYKDLMVYQKSYQLVLDVYKATKFFPSEEAYGLVSQMKRSSASIPANIAEGYRRDHRKEYIQNDSFYSIYEIQESVSRLLRRLISSLSKQGE